MNYLKLKQKIYEAIERNPLDRSAYEEMFAVCREYEKIDFQTAHAWNHELRNHISWGLRMTVSCQKFDEAREFDDLMFRSLLFGAQHFFDDYLQAVEYGKPLDKKFYQPRRHYLRRYVDAYQEILDGKLDFLSISMPKRAGKSQLGMALSEKKAKLLAMGYDEKLADDTATAMVDGDMDKVMANQTKYLEAREKDILAKKMKGTPRPAAGSENTGGMDYQKKIEEAQASGDLTAVAYYTRLAAQDAADQTE